MDYESQDLRTVLDQLERTACVSTAYEIFDVGYDVIKFVHHVVVRCKTRWSSQHSSVYDVGSSVGLALAQHSG